MKRHVCMFLTLLLVAVGLMGSAVYAIPPSGDLAIIEFKPTSNESVVIENISSGTVNIQNYILEYFNKSVPTNFNVPTSTQQLPNFTLQSQQSFLLTGDSIGTCGASGVASLSLSLSDTSGYLEVVKVSGSGGNVSYAQQDKVSWTSASSGADVVSVPSATSDANAVWYRKISDGSWNKYGLDSTPCNLYVTVTASSSPTYVSWANGDQAPSQVVVADSGNGSIPTSDLNLAPPQVTEVFPNPALPQTDDEDEFIELYNPNDSPFDLSGFKLEVGLSTLHDYTFPSGVMMEPRSFKSFYSIDTNLAMSNTSGLVKLIDPLGTVIGQSEQYSSAKEGQSWALAQGKWYWANPTPGQPNIAAITNSGTSPKTATATLSASTSNLNNSNSSPVQNSAGLQPSKIHTWTIAVIGAGALLYALYEYRADIQNNLYRFRRYRETRRNSGRLYPSAVIDRIKSRSWWWQNNSGKRHRSRAKKPKSRK